MTGYERGEPAFAALAAERYRREAATAPAPAPAPAPRWSPAHRPAKDYTVPLHVDCSIEYELPDCAKPPQGVEIEPLLMIHPSHFRRLESMRRVPFVNNLPAARAPRAARAARARCCRAAPVAAAPAPSVPAPAAPPPADRAAEYRFLLDDLLATPALAKDECGAAAFRLEAYSESCCEMRAPRDPYEASLGRYPRRQRAARAHPYLPPDCDISHSSIRGNLTATAFDLAKNEALPQLPIYM